MKNPTILVAEDDSAVRQGVVDALTFSGYHVMAATNGKQAMNYALCTQYNLLLLDLIMPHHSGFEVLEALKRNRPGQPVIILSARGEEADRIKGLKMGADDYIVKPFSVRELLARVDAVLRRTTERAPQIKKFKFKNGIACFSRREILYEHDNSTEELSDKETALLQYLVSNSGRAISREEILRQVWNLNPKGLSTRTIDMHIANLRNKLHDSDQSILLTVRGKGYMISS